MLGVAVRWSPGAHHAAPDTPFLVMVVTSPQQDNSNLATCGLMLTVNGTLRMSYREYLSKNQMNLPQSSASGWVLILLD